MGPVVSIGSWWPRTTSAGRHVTHEEVSMIVDRYTKVVLTIIAVALVAIAARPWLRESEWLDALHPAPAAAQVVLPKYEVTVPKAWGKFIAFSNNNLLLEAADQT